MTLLHKAPVVSTQHATHLGTITSAVLLPPSNLSLLLQVQVTKLSSYLCTYPPYDRRRETTHTLLLALLQIAVQLAICLLCMWDTGFIPPILSATLSSPIVHSRTFNPPSGPAALLF